MFYYQLEERAKKKMLTCHDLSFVTQGHQRPSYGASSTCRGCVACRFLPDVCFLSLIFPLCFDRVTDPAGFSIIGFNRASSHRPLDSADKTDNRTKVTSITETLDVHMNTDVESCTDLTDSFDLHLLIVLDVSGIVGRLSEVVLRLSTSFFFCTCGQV